MLRYAKQYLAIVKEDYLTIWWTLFNSAYAKKWPNILTLVEPHFCFPMSNGHVECTFSALKCVKTDLRSRLDEDHLDNLLKIAVDAPPLAQWDASGAVQLWWKDAQRRTVHDTRKKPTPKTQCTSSSLSVSEDTPNGSVDSIFDIDDWESYIDDWESYIDLDEHLL